MTFVKMNNYHDKIIQTVKKCNLLKNIPISDIEGLIENSNIIKFSSGEILANEGEPFLHCPLIISGQIEVFRHSFSGDEKIFGLFEQNEIVAIAAAFMPHNRYPMSIRAKKAGETLLLDKKNIIELCHRNPTIMQFLLTRFSTKLYENINHIDWLTSSSAEQRLAAYLLELLDKQQSSDLNLPLSRCQLAAKLGIRYETLSRLLSGWRTKNIIGIDKNFISIKNNAYLDDLAFFSKRSF